MHYEMQLQWRTLLRFLHLAVVSVASSFGLYAISNIDEATKSLVLCFSALCGYAPLSSAYLATCAIADFLSYTLWSEITYSSDVLLFGAPLAWIALRSAQSMSWRARQPRLSITLSGELFLALGLGEHTANCALTLRRIHGFFFHSELVIENVRYRSRTFIRGQELHFEQLCGPETEELSLKDEVRIAFHLSCPRHITPADFHALEHYGAMHNCQVSSLKLLLSQSWSEAWVPLIVLWGNMVYSLPCLALAGSLSRLYNAGFGRLADVIDYCSIWLATPMKDPMYIGFEHEECQHWRKSLALPMPRSHDPRVMQIDVNVLCSLGLYDFVDWTLCSEQLVYEQCTSEELIAFLQNSPAGQIFLQDLIEDPAEEATLCSVQEFLNAFRTACGHPPLVEGGGEAVTGPTCPLCHTVSLRADLGGAQVAAEFLDRLSHKVLGQAFAPRSPINPSGTFALP